MHNKNNANKDTYQKNNANKDLKREKTLTEFVQFND